MSTPQMTFPLLTLLRLQPPDHLKPSSCTSSGWARAGTRLGSRPSQPLGCSAPRAGGRCGYLKVCLWIQAQKSSMTL